MTRSQIGRGLGRNLKPALFDSLIEYGVHLYPFSRPDSITDNGVNFFWNSGDEKNRNNVFAFLKADTVVLATGSENVNKLAEELKEVVPKVYTIGDCAGKRSIFAAIRGGAEIGLKL